MIWNYEIDKIQQGYVKEEGNYRCIVCGKEYKKGRIYEQGDALLSAKGAVKQHVKSSHGGMASFLLSQESSVNGLSEIQQKLLTLILAGKSDSEIGKELGIAQSTVRNHRFKLREKEKHAKLFLAIMNQIKESTNKQIEESDTGTLQEIHSSATMVDDRYNITDVERKKTLATYLDAEGRLKQIPARAKKKIIILNEVIGRFEMKKEYTEREIGRAHV